MQAAQSGKTEILVAQVWALVQENCDGLSLNWQQVGPSHWKNKENYCPSPPKNMHKISEGSWASRKN